jgi:hypothetical protein
MPALVNPFRAGDGDYIDAESRIEKVKDFSEEECRAALKLAIQKTVRQAIERRLRKLRRRA